MVRFERVKSHVTFWKKVVSLEINGRTGTDEIEPKMLEPQPDPMPENPILKSIEPQLITLPNEYPKTIVEGWLHAAGARCETLLLVL